MKYAIAKEEVKEHRVEVAEGGALAYLEHYQWEQA